MATGISSGRSSLPRDRTNPRDGLKVVWIAPGSYITGCTDTDKECMGGGRERPKQKIVLERGFWMDRTEVTQLAYQKIMGTNTSRYPGAHHPVEQVDWKSAREYCQAVGMRLPTESEWEFAATGKIPEPRYGPLDAIAWYDPNSDDSTHDVGLKQPNSYGLFDMLGNVWEWVEDQSNVDPNRKIMKGGPSTTLPVIYESQTGRYRSQIFAIGTSASVASAIDRYQDVAKTPYKVFVTRKLRKEGGQYFGPYFHGNNSPSQHHSHNYPSALAASITRRYRQAIPNATPSGTATTQKLRLPSRGAIQAPINAPTRNAAHTSASS